ncbi:polyphosphate polymerase domain-containing protein [Streptococcus loxodontisalivarius]|uniref:SPX domain protein involved in polyphosphate accumulation n=1 Tax=Streptococcus loxodontisalivarius TaxID=1349415 RepID=A0ABS2PPN5_9STRE|nr:polyphosphate polymerase domain-containing protein [Streptococcus loxodontisalivarius]MBM7642003.1 SPX domain protein involved in polyphosphate accumulation [Streptococcus loxodontisalivarius]
MSKPLETRFKRIETKYIVAKEDLDALLTDLKVYLVEDDYPTSTISNIYFDTEDFQVIQDSIAKKNHREKIRMRTYLANPQADSQVFLEIKKKDQEGVGHKFRLVSTPSAITALLENGQVDSSITDQDLLDEIHELRQRYDGLKPRMYIYYDRYSLKEKHSIKGYSSTKVRVTIDQNLTYRDHDVSLFNGNDGQALLDEGYVIMEIKAPGQQPKWLADILEEHGIEAQKFSKYSTAYRKSQGIVPQMTK